MARDEEMQFDSRVGGGEQPLPLYPGDVLRFGSPDASSMNVMLEFGRIDTTGKPPTMIVTLYEGAHMQNGKERAIPIQNNTVTFGRYPDGAGAPADIAVRGRINVDLKHAVFRIENGQVVVADLGSQKGTHYDASHHANMEARQLVRESGLGDPQPAGELHHGDVICLGGNKGAYFRVEIDGVNTALVGLQTGTRYTVNDGDLLGRNELAAGEAAEENRVSRGHVQLHVEVSGGGATLSFTDHGSKGLGSTNGTFVSPREREQASR